MSIHHAHNAHTHHHQRRSLYSPREVPTTANTNMPRMMIRSTDSNVASSQSTTLTPTMVNLLIALLVLVIVAILAIIALFILRARRSRQRAAVVASQAEKIASSSSEESLPVFNKSSPRHSRNGNHRRLTITAAPYGRNSTPIVSYTHNEKEILLNSGASSPTSPIPEIRITFPEEEDEMGKRKSGRVVVVKVSELGGVGLEPLNEGKEGLPAYTASEGWKELDLEGMGGLKEKPRR